MAVERGAAPNASEAGAQPREPVVEEDQQGATSDVAQSYERVLAERSGTAEEVRVKDAAKGSLGKMAANPAGVEDECKRRARETVSSMRRSSENPNIADAAMDDSVSTRSALKDRGVTGSEELFPGKSTST